MLLLLLLLITITTAIIGIISLNPGYCHHSYFTSGKTKKQNRINWQMITQLLTEPEIEPSLSLASELALLTTIVLPVNTSFHSLVYFCLPPQHFTRVANKYKDQRREFMGSHIYME